MDLPFFEIPPLFNVICVALGCGLLVAPFFWLLHVWRGGDVTLNGAMAFTFLRIVLWVGVCSFIYGTYNGQGLSALWVECVFILSLILCFVLKRVRLYVEIVRQCLLVLLMFIVSAHFLFVYMILGNFIDLVVFICAGVHLGLLGLIYHYVIKFRQDLDVKFYILLWPLVLGLIALILPLLLSHIANDIEVFERFNRPPPMVRV